MNKTEIGHVSNYYGKISVAAVEVTHGSVTAGDTLQFLGHTTDCKTRVDSMQIDHEPVTEAKKGDSIGVKVPTRVRRGDKVYKVSGEP